MPARKLPLRHTHPAPAYSVVGTYTRPEEREFVGHVAILTEETRLRSGQSVRVWHMGPPLVVGQRTAEAPRASRQCGVHLVGGVRLDLLDVEGIEDWLSEVDKEPGPENPFRRYIVRPHWDWYEAPETGRRLYRRFSCVGFVLECFRCIDVDLLVTDESELPGATFATLAQAYPMLQREAAIVRRFGVNRLDLGLGGEGPWPVVLPGYVFHALQRFTAESPRPTAYGPQSVDEARFPRRQ